MSRVIYEYDSIEDQDSIILAHNSQKLYMVLSDIKSSIRSRVKYEETGEKEHEFLSSLLDEINFIDDLLG